MTAHSDVALLVKRYWPMVDVQLVAADMRGLSDVPPDELVLAIERFRQEAEHPFPPAPGQLRKLCGRSKGIEARDAWEHVRSLPRCPASNSVERYTDRGKWIEEQWRDVYADERMKAGLRAIDRFGGLSGLLAADVENARRAFCGAWSAANSRDELGAGRPASIQAPTELLQFARKA